ncbi:MAG: EscU/YscU/HrcU family type III secretion system export apparatus switch protein [Myxococcota bacterium]
MEHRFPPTAKRLARARREGDVLRSPTLGGAVVLSATLALTIGLLPGWLEHMRAVATALWVLVGFDLPPDMIAPVVVGALVESARASVVIVLGVALSALLMGLLQVRPLWTTLPLRFDPGRLGPQAWWMGIHSGASGLEAASQIIRAVAVLLVAGRFIWEQAPVWMRLPTLQAAAAAEQLMTLGFGLGVRLGALAVIFGGLDLALQRHLRLQRLTMTRAEIERERRENDVQPLVKQRRRLFYRPPLMEGGLDAVPSARMVVTGPQGSVALYYQGGDRAPVVVARGSGAVGHTIVAHARNAGVSIAPDAELASVLLELELGQSIPQRLFEPTARAIQRYAPRTPSTSTDLAD